MSTRNRETQEFEKISPTALLCAKFRAEYTNLPYAKEIYGLTIKYKQKDLRVTEDSLLESMLNTASSRLRLSILEGRHIAINDALARLNGYIIELAAGFSTRGLALPNKRYIETDLPGLISLKKKITRKIKKHNKDHYIIPLNPLNLTEFIKLAERFKMEDRKDKHVTIVSEGLFMYLTKEEQKQMRNNIALFLQKYSPEGFWVTTDFSSRPINNCSVTTEVMRKIEQRTNREYNRFKKDSDVKEFLSTGGMNGNPLDNSHLTANLSCLKKLNLTLEEADSVRDRYRAWKIGLK